MARRGQPRLEVIQGGKRDGHPKRLIIARLESEYRATPLGPEGDGERLMLLNRLVALRAEGRSHLGLVR